MIRKEEKYINIFICIIFVIGACIIALAVSYSFGNEQYEEKIQDQRYADSIIANIIYIKDPRTNICFAYYKDSSIDKIYAGLATVPCDSIPPDLLK